LGDEAPDRIAPATKRFIGRRFSAELARSAKAAVPYPLIQGPNQEVRIKLAGKMLPITQISAMILGELKLDAEAHFGRLVTKAVITVPANFDDGQRNATRDAAQIAGLDVLRIINEPTAAAVAYGLSNQFKGRALVFDLGGGTFDVSILEVDSGVFEVKATGGDPQLGGEDFDQCIVEWLLAQVPEPYGEVVAKDRRSLLRLRHAAEQAKRTLSERTEAFVSVQELGDTTADLHKLTHVDTALTREFFESLSESLTQRCFAVCQRVLHDAKHKPQDIDAVLLVGGMTRVPSIRRLAKQFFGKEPVGGINPDEVVAVGAAVHAAELQQKQGAALLIDVATHSLSVGVLGGAVRKLIWKNTPVPASAREMFLPSKAKQERAIIPVFQGESDWVDECTRLGEVTLTELSVGERQDVPIEVKFELSNEGILTVRAVDTTTGIAQAVRIEARTALQPGEVEKLAAEQGAYQEEQGAKDRASAVSAFPRILEKAERLVGILEQSAHENPSDEARAAVGQLRVLVDQGRIALKASDIAQMGEVTRMLERLIGS
jgi:molecular chaperone DnaK